MFWTNRLVIFFQELSDDYFLQFMYISNQQKVYFGDEKMKHMG